MPAFITARKILTLNKGVGGITTLRREANGTVTALSLAAVSALFLTRQTDGTVMVGAA